jgi:hypothetical protein
MTERAIAAMDGIESLIVIAQETPRESSPYAAERKGSAGARSGRG